IIQSIFSTTPPTTAIYTLSLHDALPISTETISAFTSGETSVLPLDTTKSGTPTAGNGAAGILRNQDHSTHVLWRRKSKRIIDLEIGRAHVYSSHVSISYAVFCLKKKKI